MEEKSKMLKKSLLKLTVGAAMLCGVSAANALTVSSFTIADVTGDGISGAFRFAPINAAYFGASLFTGDVAAAPGTAMGQIDTSVANPMGTFSTGFLFSGAPFVPFTAGPSVMDITGGALTVTSLPWGGNFAGATDFYLSPDAGTLTVYFLNDIGGGNYNYKMGWSHLITDAEDPSGQFAGFNARWIIEGVMTTAVPVPAAVWLLGSGLIGLVGVARRRKALVA
jgi:hypothetical protein